VCCFAGLLISSLSFSFWSLSETFSFAFDSLFFGYGFSYLSKRELDLVTSLLPVTTFGKLFTLVVVYYFFVVLFDRPRSSFYGFTFSFFGCGFCGGWSLLNRVNLVLSLLLLPDFYFGW